MSLGAGIRFALAQSRDTNASESPYSGEAKGFRMKLEGKTSGQTIRIGFTQDPNATFSDQPYVLFTTLGEKELYFEDVSCPIWSPYCTDAGYGGPNPYDLFVMIAGGDIAGDFDVCLTSLVPFDD